MGMGSVRWGEVVGGGRVEVKGWERRAGGDR